MQDITKKLKKGHVVQLCDELLKESMAAVNASAIEKAQTSNDLNKVVIYYVHQIIKRLN